MLSTELQELLNIIGNHKTHFHLQRTPVDEEVLEELREQDEMTDEIEELCIQSGLVWHLVFSPSDRNGEYQYYGDSFTSVMKALYDDLKQYYSTRKTVHEEIIN